MPDDAVEDSSADLDEAIDADVLGPIDWIVVEFPGSRFRGEVAPLLQDLIDRDLVRVLDLLVLKNSEGTMEAFELTDLEASEIGDLPSHRLRSLPAGPASICLRASGISGSMRRAGVVAPVPVARAAGTVATVAVVSHGVNRRHDRRDDRRDRRR